MDPTRVGRDGSRGGWAGGPAARRVGAVIVAAVTAITQPARADDTTLPTETLAPNVFHVPGHQAAWGRDFHGHVANLAFVIGSRCIAVIDSGGSATVGRALLASVRQRSALPICYVINTHPHPDHVLGNLAFVEANAAADGATAAPVFVGHARLRASLAARAPFYLNALRRDFDVADHTPSVPLPTLAVTDRMALDLGGRVLDLRAWPTAHTDSDLTVHDRTSGTLWLGDLLFVGHLPVLDGNLKGWLAVLQGLKREAAQRLVPGHGAVQAPGPEAFDATERYLTQLQSDVGTAIDEGLTLSQTVARLGTPPETRMAGWLLVDAFHRRNVTAAYAELEWAK
jgi:quinoprotein relay system zinc metallohydrolase 2